MQQAARERWLALFACVRVIVRYCVFRWENIYIHIHTWIQDSPREWLLAFFACVRVIIQYCVFTSENIHVYIHTHESRTLLVSGCLLFLPVFVLLFNIACLGVRVYTCTYRIHTCTYKIHTCTYKHIHPVLSSWVVACLFCQCSCHYSILRVWVWEYTRIHIKYTRVHIEYTPVDIEYTRVHIHTSIQDSPREDSIAFFACVCVSVQYCVLTCENIYIHVSVKCSVFACENIYVYIYTHRLI